MYSREKAIFPSVLTDCTRFYNDDTFSDVTILMLGQRPNPSKAARKSVTPIYTFNAHKIVLSAGSSVFFDYFRDHPKVLSGSFSLCFSIHKRFS